MLDVSIEIESASSNNAQKKSAPRMFTGSLHLYEACNKEKERRVKAPDTAAVCPPLSRTVLLRLSTGSLWTDRSFANSPFPLTHGDILSCYLCPNALFSGTKLRQTFSNRVTNSKMYFSRGVSSCGRQSRDRETSGKIVFSIPQHYYDRSLESTGSDRVTNITLRVAINVRSSFLHRFSADLYRGISVA